MLYKLFVGIKNNLLISSNHTHIPKKGWSKKLRLCYTENGVRKIVT
jgi:hypothetical protein